MHNTQETIITTRSIGVAYSTEPSPIRILTNLPPPYTWTGARAGELRYVVISSKGARRDDSQLTNHQSQSAGLYMHDQPIHRPQTHAF